MVSLFLFEQDSLHVSQLAAQERAVAAAAAAAAKKKGLKSSLGRIFGKKEKGLKTRVVGAGGGGGGGGMGGSHYVTAPLSLGGGHSVYMGESEMVSSDSMAGLGGLAGKGDFDRRKKKK